MSYIITKGATSQSIELYIVDSTNGTPETGVLWNTAGIDLKYRRKDAAVVSITEAALTTPALTDTWETGGFLEIGNGVYRLDLPDAALASAAGIDRVVVFGTVTGMVVLPVTIHLTAFDLSTALASQTVGTCTTNTDMAGTDNAALASVLGAAVGASISADIADLPTVAEFEARTIVSADYVVVGDTLARVTLTDTVTTYTGNTKQTGDNFARLGAPAGASVSADIASVPTVNEIWAKAMSDLATGAPSATASVLTAINYLYEALRNKTLTTATLVTIKKDDGATDLMKSTISDDATTFTKNEFVSG